MISGVFYSSDSLPAGLAAVAEALPLKHVIDGFSDAIVTGNGLSHELGALAVLVLWGVAGVTLAIRGFRFER
jgi:ABC-type polysaccharide/polyol phosphate export permease